MQNYSPVYPYPNAYNQYIQTPVIPQQNSNPIMAWVQSGMEGAKMYPVPLNSRAYLFDSEEDCFYVKVTDDMGRVTSFRKFKYEEDIVEEAADNNPNPEYVTKKDLEDAMRSLAEEIKNNNYRKGGHNNGKSFVRGTDEPRDDRNVR